MTKRRAENVLLSDVPNKRLSSLCGPETHHKCAHMVQTTASPSLLTLVGNRCRKRPNFFEEEEESHEFTLSPKKTLTSMKNSPDRGMSSGRFRDESKPPVRSSSCVPPKTGTREGVTCTDEDLSSYNSFQYWRVPLPELDLSLLDGDNASETSGTSHSKDLEAMET
ncbi:uncharacterized protein C9orf40 homolog [Chanos chanos]|uniref:Uncharacterized protein C9orf40 homolog n=1 Tax=Chanos chanos TaxID=29144 RepID=A0A6J2WTV7_CHACN|nr:uncharacterized protein C9orf40 homolog [Chanos chanos]